MIIKKEDVFAVYINEKIFHLDCVDLADVEEEDIMFRNTEVDEIIAFCDECGERIH